MDRESTLFTTKPGGWSLHLSHFMKWGVVHKWRHGLRKTGSIILWILKQKSSKNKMFKKSQTSYSLKNTWKLWLWELPFQRAWRSRRTSSRRCCPLLQLDPEVRRSTASSSTLNNKWLYNKSTKKFDHFTRKVIFRGKGLGFSEQPSYIATCLLLSRASIGSIPAGSLIRSFDFGFCCNESMYWAITLSSMIRSCIWKRKFSCFYYEVAWC